MRDKRHMNDAEDQKLSDEQIDRRMIDALADYVLASGPDEDMGEIDLANDANALTAEDLLAFEARGTPEDLAQWCIDTADESELESAHLVGDESTCYLANSEEGTVIGPDEQLPDEDDLNVRIKAIQNAQVMTGSFGYLKLHELGHGRQGVVYLIESIDELSRTTQALKVYSPKPYASAVAYREDMQRIASVVHQMQHDNVIDVQRFFEYEGVYVMVMQLIDGFDLRRLLKPDLFGKLQKSVDSDRWRYLDKVIYSKPSKDRIGLQPMQAVNIIEKCLRGLGALHEKGIVHGDIKPSNIMLDCNGSIRLVDVGSAYAYESQPRHRVWTPRYAPPEFLDRNEWTPQSDLASLGYVLLELLTGRADLGGPKISDDSVTQRNPKLDRALLSAKRSLPQRLDDLLPENVLTCKRLIGLCKKLIDPDPARRFSSADEAMASEECGTWRFRVDIIQGNLGVHEVSAIKHWIRDVKRFASRLGLCHWPPS